jgi:DNA-binding CsgD family transcriptional regulator
VKAEQALTEKEEELMIKTKSVEETNTALRVLLNRKGEDKAKLEEKVLSNVKELVMPFLEKVKNTQLNREQVSYIDIIELNLSDIISPFLQNFSVKYASLTPAELQVASLVRHGVPSKEIANIFDVSIRTIDSHRANIRKKLKIKNKKSNLASYLATHH